MSRNHACCLLAWLGLGAPLTAQATWRSIPELPRRAPALATDPLRGRVVLFGGARMTRLADTWEWNGKTWELRRPLTSPSPRTPAAAAFDWVGRSVLIFGGKSGRSGLNAVLLNDTWSWDGADWSQKKPRTAPTPRWGSAMAADPIRKRTVLYGGALTVGINPRPSGDTWEWDGSKWTQHFPKTQPGPRYGHGMAFNPKTGRVVMFGGQAGLNPLPVGTWEWDGKDWIKVASRNDPSPRVGGMATHPGRSTVILHGHLLLTKALNPHTDETWELDGTQWRKLVPNSTSGLRRNPTIVSDTATRNVFCFGGVDVFVQKGRWFPKTWSFDGVAWKQKHEWLEPLGGASAVYDQARDQILVTGTEWPYSNNVGKFPLTTWVLGDDGGYRRLKPPSSPPGRHLPSLVYHAGLKKVVLFGGYTSAQLKNDLWLWDGKTWTEDKSQPRPQTSGGSQILVYDSHRQKLVFVYIRRTWEWDAKGWVQRQTSASPGYPTGLAYDPLRKRTVLYGVERISNRERWSTWEWDGTQWVDRRASLQPPKRYASWMAFVPGLGGVVLFGAQAGGFNPFSDTWLWDGKTWTKLSVPALPTHGNYPVEAATYDSGRQRIVALHRKDLAGRDTWEFLVESLRTTRPHPRPGQSLSFQARLPGQANNALLLALSLASRPGIPLRPVPGVGVEMLPLRPDALFWLSLQANLSTVLNTQGLGNIPLVIPNDAALLWLDFHAAGLVLKPGGVISAITNRVPLEIVK